MAKSARRNGARTVTKDADSERLARVRRNAERTAIALALIENGHSRTGTAEQLGISRRTLHNKIKEYGLTLSACFELVVETATDLHSLAESASRRKRNERKTE
ncbi:MAG TPA: helix-turn-helix domain-containing protein [Polyangiales bacterium]|jgi:DNA-binding NtrC family response regulator|nr:helix-turn-helix domain-containing protein [Polyangiales bacterium]